MVEQKLGLNVSYVIKQIICTSQLGTKLGFASIVKKAGHPLSYVVIY